MKIPSIIQTELDAVAKGGIAYHIEFGGRHQKIIIGGRFAGILPIGKVREGGREVLNVRSQIRRVVRALTS